MSRPVAVTSCVPWDPNAAAHRDASASPDDHHQREILSNSYNKVLEALDAAAAVVADVASGLYDVEASQTDVSMRLCSRPVRFTGKKRKLSPSVYDYGESCFAAASKADTPTQELLPASRSELRNHQLQAVRWLSSLERQGAGGVLADELVQDRRAEVAGLMSHLASNPPDCFPTLPPPQPQPTPLQQQQPAVLSPLPAHHQHQQYHHHQPHPQQQQQLSHNLGGGHCGGCGGGGGGLPLGGAHHGGGGGGGGNVCLLLAPGGSLTAWSEVIQEHVNVFVHLYDGTAANAAALQAACAAAAAGGAGGLATAAPPPYVGATAAAGGGCGPMGRRIATGGACPLKSSAAGVFPPAVPAVNPPPPSSASSRAAHLPPLMRGSGAPAGPAAASPRFVLILAPLEHLQRDVALLTQIHQRLLIVDLAPGGSCGGSEGGGGCGSRLGRAIGGGVGGSGGDSSGDRGHGHFSVFGGFGSAPGSGSGSGSGPRGEGHQHHHQPGRRRLGMDLEGFPNLHLLTRLPAESRVLLSAGVPDPVGDGIWLLLQLLAPAVQRPLWVAINDLQHGLLASGSVGAQQKDSVLSEVHGRLWALLRPLMLHRRARDVDLETMRTANTNLNLYDHFSAARAEGA